MCVGYQHCVLWDEDIVFISFDGVACLLLILFDAYLVILSRTTNNMIVCPPTYPPAVAIAV